MESINSSCIQSYKEGYFPPRPSDLPKNKKRVFNPESFKNNRIPPDELAAILLKHDVISFDIFDTLVLRPFISRYDSYLLASCKYEEAKIYRLRVVAEEDILARMKKNGDAHEINIYDIYREMAKYVNIDPIRGAELEIKTEIDVCYANPYIKLVYDMVREHDREIIAVSDMYIPKEWMLKLLHKCGYDYFTDIFISCDYGINKRNSQLFQIAQNKIGREKSYIHTGVSSRSDVTSPKKAGWNSYHLPSVHFFGGMYRPPQTNDKQVGLSTLIGAAYAGIVNCHLHNGLRKESDYYEFGFKCGGPFAIGFSAWIHDKCKKEKIEKVLFTSRDGYTLKLIYDKLYCDIPSEYTLWSHSIAAKVSAKNFPHYFNNLLLYERSDHGYYDKNKVVEELKQFRIQCISSQNINQYEELIQYVTDHMEEMIDALNEEEKAVKKYYRGVIGANKKIACVDIGWTGMNFKTLKEAVESRWNPECKIIGLLAGLVPQSRNVVPVKVNEFDKDVFIYSPIINTEQMNFFMEKASEYPYFYEILSGAPHAAIYDVGENNIGGYEFMFNIPDVENYWAISEIRKGMMDFADIYTERFEKYPFMFHIPGNDASLIIHHELMKNKDLSNDFGVLSSQSDKMMPPFGCTGNKIKL